MVSPAFVDAASLRNRIDAVAVGLIDAAIRPPSAARSALSRELLALSSVLSMAQAGGLLSAMNAELIAHEAHTLLQEVATYEEPRLFLDDAPTIASIAKQVPHEYGEVRAARRRERELRATQQSDLNIASRPARLSAALASQTLGQTEGTAETDKGQQPERVKDRREAVLSLIREKGEASIKDISTRFREVSEKTIQRELVSLVQSGAVGKRGERRWSVYYVL